MLGLKEDDKKKDSKKDDKKQTSQNEEAQKVLAEINAKAGGDDCPFC